MLNVCFIIRIIWHAAETPHKNNWEFASPSCAAAASGQLKEERSLLTPQEMLELQRFVTAFTDPIRVELSSLRAELVARTAVIESRGRAVHMLEVNEAARELTDPLRNEIRCLKEQLSKY